MDNLIYGHEINFCGIAFNKSDLMKKESEIKSIGSIIEKINNDKGQIKAVVEGIKKILIINNKNDNENIYELNEI